MRNHRPFVVHILGALALLVVVARGGLAQQEPPLAPIDQLQSATDALNTWLDRSASGPAWTTFLKLEQLEAQIALGQEADDDIVADILAKFESETKGLDSSRFVAVRDALKVWAVELARPTFDELPQAIRDAKDQFVAPSEDGLRDAKNEVIRAFNELARYLAKAGGTRESSWKSYLKWIELRGQLVDKEAPDVALLQQVLAKYNSGQPGLELEKFAAVRQALRKWSDMAALAADAEAEQSFQTQLGTLAAAVEQYRQEPTAEHAEAVGMSLGWLERAGQVGELTQYVRHFHSHPNAFMQVSRSVMSAGIERSVSQSSPVSDNMMGTSITGTSHTVGNVTLELVPSIEEATFDIIFKGRATTNSTGYNGPVTIHTTGVTGIAGRKRLFFNTDGMRDVPAVARARTSTSINNISASRPQAERIAWDQASANKPQAERMTSQRAESRLRTRLNSQARTMVADANKSFRDRFRKPLDRRDEFPKLFQTSTTLDALSMKALQANEFQMGAPGAPPELAAAHDLAMRIHESLIRNYGEATLGGIKMTDEAVAKRYEEMTGEVPEELKLSPDKEPWSMRFSRVKPVVATFSGGQMVAVLSAKQFTRGDQELNRAVTISATYNATKTDTGSKLIREGDVQIDFPDREGERLGARDVAFRTFMRRKFEAMFEPEFTGDGLVLPGNWKKAGKLRLVQLDADGGWLTLGWKQPPVGQRQVD